MGFCVSVSSVPKVVLVSVYCNHLCMHPTCVLNFNIMPSPLCLVLYESLDNYISQAGEYLSEKLLN